MKLCILLSPTEKGSWITPINQSKSFCHDMHWKMRDCSNATALWEVMKSFKDLMKGSLLICFYSLSLIKRERKKSLTRVCTSASRKPCVCVGVDHSFILTMCEVFSVWHRAELLSNHKEHLSHPEVLHRHIKSSSVNFFLIPVSCLFSQFSDLLAIY